MSGFEVQWIRFQREVEKNEERVVDGTWSDRVRGTAVRRKSTHTTTWRSPVETMSSTRQLLLSTDEEV